MVAQCPFTTWIFDKTVEIPVYELVESLQPAFLQKIQCTL